MTALLNERQTAEYLGVTPRALQAWRTRGGGPPYLRVGHRTIRYHPADLDAWLADRRYSSTAEESEYGRTRQQ